jgi:hypothetical protein
MTFPLVIIPAYSHIDHRLMMAMLEARLALMPLHGASDLPRARSLLISLALAREPERVLFIDSDIVPTAAQLVELATSPLVTPDQALTGLYPIRDTRATVRGGATWAVDAVDPETAEGAPVFAANWAGLGFAAVSAESLRRVADTLPDIVGDEAPWKPFCLPFVDGAAGRYYPEDRSLWWRLGRTGTRLVASASLKVGHVAQVVLTEAR